MRPAGQFGQSVVVDQRLVAGVVVHHQGPLPRAQEVGGVPAGTAEAVVEHDDGPWAGTSIGEQVGAPGLASPWIELGDRRLVGMQHRRLQEFPAQDIDQRLQAQPDHPDPFSQGPAMQLDAVTDEDRFLPVQRQVVDVFLDGHLGQQARGGHPSIQD